MDEVDTPDDGRIQIALRDVGNQIPTMAHSSPRQRLAGKEGRKGESEDWMGAFAPPIFVSEKCLQSLALSP
jgi:hypothetical protein